MTLLVRLYFAGVAGVGFESNTDPDRLEGLGKAKRRPGSVLERTGQE